MEADGDGRGEVADAALRAAITVISDGGLVLASAEGVGRCVVASEPLQRGALLRDRTLFVGTSRGESLLRAAGRAAPTELEGDAGEVAELDLAAAVAEGLLQGPTAAERDALAAVLLQEAPGVGVAVVRRLYGMLREPLKAALPLERLEECWRAFPLNWHHLNVAPLSGSLLAETPEGPAALALRRLAVAGLFVIGSIMEHSCRPNMGMHWEAGELRFVALRPVAAGERVSQSYLDLAGLALPAAGRRALLRSGWRFSCRCARCVEELAAGAGGVPDGGGSTPATLAKAHEPRPTAPFEAPVLRRLQVAMRALRTEDGGRAMQECRVALRDALSMGREVHGFVEQTSLQLLLYAALIGSLEEAEEFARQCSEFFGESSEWTAAARLLEQGPVAFLGRLMRDAEAEAGRLGLRLTAHRPPGGAGVAEAQGVLRELCREVLCGEARWVRPPCSWAYVPCLPPSLLSAEVAERSGQAGAGAEAPPATGPRRTSRFREQRRALRGGGAEPPGAGMGAATAGTEVATKAWNMEAMD